MCDPVTAAVVAVSIVAVSAGVGAVGSYRQAKAQKDAAKYQARVASNNAEIANRKADDRIARGRQEERNFRKQLSGLKGKQRSIYAGSGVVVDEDSPLEVLGQTAELGELDALTLRSNVEREAYGHRVQGFNFQAQSNLHTAEARNTQPLFSAFSTLLTGASSGAAMFAGPPSTPPTSTPAPTGK